jgi:hypothetical protein
MIYFSLVLLLFIFIYTVRETTTEARSILLPPGPLAQSSQRGLNRSLPDYVCLQIAGRQLLEGKMTFDGVRARNHFDSFGWGFVTVFQASQRPTAADCDFSCSVFTAVTV